MRIRRIRPAIHSIELTDEERSMMNEETVSQCERWGWVDLEELFRCLNDARREKRMMEFGHPRAIFEAFGELNYHFKGEIQTNWIREGAFGQGGSVPDTTDSGVMVPAGWANNAIDLTEKWIKRVDVNKKATGLVATKHNGVKVSIIKRSGHWTLTKQA